ncbi:uncharacterized protein LOC113239082 [Hyposmocoma kahamanoa]|uniref:uncharacterized protein LOC113239082 n=1 Tax=Hyposmocoma kahamanoa TaxID=1477025 RepID=UPI000E6D7251|nr:uncharacterized protein LOC113239082 [Hyposmocoma kahamanoa]
MSGLIKGSENQPIAQQTKLGWILSGPVQSPLQCSVVINNIEDISAYWEVEEIANASITMTREEQFCEELYVNTTRRLPDGRYEVRLPLKNNFENELGQSKARAVAQFKQLESRLMKKPHLRDSYQKFMHEYEDLGHMIECKERKEPMCYLPHHGVYREESTTTKLRAVFNASSPTSTGKSLNDLMECGPKLQKDIQDLLLRWRIYQYVYTADCEKMYRCILLQEDQQHLQKIFWRDNPQDRLKEYQLCTITYGMKAAPFLAMRTMQQLASDDKEKYPLAAEVLQRQFYVDDLLGGNHSLSDAKEVQQQLIKMFQGAKINLRKWSSNCAELLSELSADQINPTTMDFKNANSTKALGLQWSPATDMFTFRPIDNNKTKTTKRTLLSQISKIFDPLGWLSPLSIRAKLLFQKLWLVTMEWDDEVPCDILKKWNKLSDDLQNVDKFQIPRWIGNIHASIEIHGFCDASEQAYAAVIYIKTTNDMNESIVRIFCSKTKLAPRKNTLTLPRLELCGALLLSKLMQKVLKAFPHTDIPIYGWTDSLVVLGWLQGQPSRWKAFVANRTKEILDIMPVSCWRHVSSNDNAADCATRGLTTSQLTEHTLWWEGPAWIKKPISKNDTHTIDMPQIEMKNEPQICATMVETTDIIEELLHKHHSIMHIVRVIARISRFINIVRHRVSSRLQSSRPQHDTEGISRDAPDNTNYITASEINNALIIVIRVIQTKEFRSDISELKRKGVVMAKSNLLQLQPFFG